ncbi:ubiquinone biosynthesis methyltransferase [Aphelenchoides avenae]|nr:ubiquinone biosynthesis methyltransferase [Aphelenchus avenae]
MALQRRLLPLSWRVAARFNSTASSASPTGSTDPSDSTTTHFGYQRVDKQEKAKKVHTVFANVAQKYDLMNDAMSLGIHRLWKDYFVSRLDLRSGAKVLDVAGGTGDIAFRIVRKVAGRGGEVTISDINENMLEVGQLRAEEDATIPHQHLKWVCADAEKLPFDADSFDFYTIAFGIRNCTNVDKVLAEAYRVLRPGGTFSCLEFSRVHPTLRPIYDAYSFGVIPLLGQVLASDAKSYRYLVESIRMFPDQEAFATMIRDAGFTNISYENLSVGICAIHTATKP